MHPGFIITNDTRCTGCAACVIANMAVSRRDVSHWLLEIALMGGLICV
jgi:Fe-S-cluster-containing dehydrogenase component